MNLTLTLKVGADTKDELMGLPSQYAAFKSSIEGAIAQSGFAGLPAEKVTLRWIVQAGVWGTPGRGFPTPVPEPVSE